MPHKQTGKGFIENMFSAGIGAYAAKNSSSMSGLLMTLVKYAAVIIVGFILLMVVLRILNIGNEYFMVPVAPSKTGDNKEVTPAGNTILY